ncbi:MAG TPA: hypothetical protein DIU14_03620 [Actinobacteria bacterium]|nr:hypothetical protein [Actinomycetota bacterium]
MVAGHRPGDGFQPAPRGVVGLLERGQRALLVLLVAQREHRRDARVQQQIGRCLGTAGLDHPVAAVVLVVRGVASDVAGHPTTGAAGPAGVVAEAAFDGPETWPAESDAVTT